MRQQHRAPGVTSIIQGVLVIDVPSINLDLFPQPFAPDGKSPVSTFSEHVEASYEVVWGVWQNFLQ
jgi:hypothetical protein